MIYPNPILFADPIDPNDEPQIQAIPARVRRSDPISSHEAAEAIKETAASQCAKILELVKRCPDHTTAELAEITGWPVHTLGRRLPELRDAHKMVINPAFWGRGESGLCFTPCRKCSVSGRLALTWRAV